VKVWKGERRILGSKSLAFEMERSKDSGDYFKGKNRQVRFEGGAFPESKKKCLGRQGDKKGGGKTTPTVKTTFQKSRKKNRTQGRGLNGNKQNGHRGGKATIKKKNRVPFGQKEGGWEEKGKS